MVGQRVNDRLTVIERHLSKLARGRAIERNIERMIRREIKEIREGHDEAPPGPKGPGMALTGEGGM